MSTASSLRPMSTSSGNSGASSVKWDEDGLETVKEGESRKASQDAKRGRKVLRKVGGILGKGGNEFLSLLSLASQTISPTVGNPMLTVEEATADGHDVDDL